MGVFLVELGVPMGHVNTALNAEVKAAAREHAYRSVARIRLAGSHHRTDIAERAAVNATP
jgi:phosphoribosylamine-glycine ligase